MKITEIILKPKITEKALKNSDSLIYSFEVNTLANKPAIADAIEKIFGVKVGKVHTAIKRGKQKRVGKRGKIIQRPDKKIATVKLSSGKIELFPKTK